MSIGVAQLHLLPDGADLRAAAGLEPAACAADAVARTAIAPGDRVAVVGGGTIGLLTLQLLLAESPARVVLFEPNQRRRDLAVSWGATALHPDDAHKEAGFFDVVVEAAGATTAATLAVDLARRGGRVVLAGIPDARATMSVRDVVAKRLRVETVFGASTQSWDAAVAAFAAGVLDPGLLVTHEFDLAHAAEAIALVATPSDTTGKVLLHP